eukprot:3429231-Rhodomonas_salina.1
MQDQTPRRRVLHAVGRTLHDSRFRGHAFGGGAQGHDEGGRVVDWAFQDVWQEGRGIRRTCFSSVAAVRADADADDVHAAAAAGHDSVRGDAIRRSAAARPRLQRAPARRSVTAATAGQALWAVSYTHLRAHETEADL